MFIFGAFYFSRKTRSGWLDRQMKMAWYERDAFRTRMRLVNTEIEALTADNDIRAFAETDAPYAYTTITAFRKLFRNTALFTESGSALQLTSAYPDARVVGPDGTMSKTDYLRYELRADAEQQEKILDFMAADQPAFMQFSLSNPDGSLRELVRIHRRRTQDHDLFFFSRLRPQFFLQSQSELPFLLLEHDGSLLASRGSEEQKEECASLLVQYSSEELRSTLSSEEPLLLGTTAKMPMILYRLPDTSITLVLFPPGMPQITPYILLAIAAFLPLLIFFALLLSSRISRRLYKPIEIALEPLPSEENSLLPPDEEAEDTESKTSAVTPSSRPDELELITRRLENFRRLAEDMETLRKEHAAYRDRDFFANLLEGVILPQYKDSKLLQRIEEGTHTLCILEFAESEYGENMLLFQEIQTIFSEDEDCRLLNEGLRRFIIIYLGCSQAETEKKIRAHLAELQSSLPWYAALADSRPGSAGLEESYLEGLNLMDFRYRLPENSFLFTRDLPSSHSSYYYYPVSEEQRLTRLIVDGNESALELFDKLWRENTILRTLTAEAAKDFVFALVHTLRRSAQELKINLNQLPDVRHDQAEYIEKHWQEKEIGHDIRELLSALLRCKNVRGSSEDEILKEKMYSFIAQNYYDDIMLNDLADYLGFTPKYCSALFARLMDENFKEYLNRYRVIQAIRILKEDEDILVSDLAATVGFNSSNSFIRVFRRFTGTTPGKYMKEQKS